MNEGPVLLEVSLVGEGEDRLERGEVEHAKNVEFFGATLHDGGVVA